MPRRPSVKRKLKELNAAVGNVEAVVNSAPVSHGGRKEAAGAAVGGSYEVEFPASPTTGDTRGITDGEIMRAMEPIGFDLDFTLPDAAKALGITLTSLTFRIFSSHDLREFFKLVRRSRAQLAMQERDKITANIVRLAGSGELDQMTFKALNLKLRLLESDMKVFDREVFGNKDPEASKKHTLIDGMAGIPALEVTTSLDG